MQGDKILYQNASLFSFSVVSIIYNRPKLAIAHLFLAISAYFWGLLILAIFIEYKLQCALNYITTIVLIYKTIL